MSDDSALISAWKAGDDRAGEELVRKYFQPLYRFFRTKLPSEAEDLVQRTFLDCIEAAAATEIETFRAFLFSVAHRRLADHLRQHFRKGECTDPLEHSVEWLGTSPSEHAARSETRDAVLEAIQRLPVTHQVAIELFYWENFKGHEIAQILGISEKTVRSRLTKARTKLRAELGSSFESALAR